MKSPAFACLDSGNEPKSDYADKTGDKLKTLSIIFLLVAVMLVFAARRKTVASSGTLGVNAGNALRKSRKTQQVPRNPYRGTAIAHDVNACDAVKAIRSKCFLDAERATPLLPLPGCDRAQCNCKYAYHEDRRTFDEEDRRHPYALRAQLFASDGNPEKRARKRGRRKSDWA